VAVEQFNFFQPCPEFVPQKWHCGASHVPSPVQLLQRSLKRGLGQNQYHEVERNPVGLGVIRVEMHGVQNSQYTPDVVVVFQSVE